MKVPSPLLAIAMMACVPGIESIDDPSTNLDRPSGPDPIDDPTEDPQASEDPEFEIGEYPSEEQRIEYDRVRLEVDADLATLRNLDAFEIHGMITPQTASTGFCYGPCADEVAAYIDQAARLADLADDAVETADSANDPVGDVTEHLDALAGLEIVYVGDLIVDEAVPSPYCYNLVCPGDQAAVDETNAERRARVAKLAELAADLAP